LNQKKKVLLNLVRNNDDEIMMTTGVKLTIRNNL